MPKFDPSSWRFQVILFVCLSSVVGSVWAYRYHQPNRDFDEAAELVRANDIPGATEIFDRLAATGDLQGLYGSAWTAYRRGEYDRAGFYADFLADEADGDLRAAAFYLQGLLATVVGLDQRARGRYLASLTKYKQSGNTEGIYVASLRLAATSIHVGDPETALSLLEDLEKERADADGSYWYHRGQAHFLLGNVDRAREDIETSFEIFSRGEVILGQANALAELGWQFMLTGNFEMGLQRTEEALALVDTPKETAYYRLNVLVYQRCTGRGWEPLAEDIRKQATRTNDKLLERYLEKAIKHPCEVTDVQIPRNR